ncbi:cytochrome P450 [Halieaceae bacterium IMCC14734]|uniref:Cytochrome P450 n=1 Tax=Candidatus Litorirhabdus singularis TaxID=2518993 RepID=A0ABT3TE00_9GAMM|nr:cytochrome P450 [Candidatus Litorirhabdus singularis]MCX2980415.1 cytochrome P450 [Candidatus Litorirhabdus singularis]
MTARQSSDTSDTVTPGWYGINPATDDLKTDPHARFAHLRETAPINLTPEGRWRLSRYADIQQLLKHSSVGMRHRNGLIPDHSREDSENSKFMLRMDPPDHDRLRKLVSKAFTPAALAALRPQVQAVVDGELDQSVRAGEMDLAEDFALLVPAASMCAMLGINFSDRQRLSRLVSHATYILAVKAFPELQGKAHAALEELAGYMLDLIEERRANPGTDILSAMVMAEETGDKLSTEELLQQGIGLLIAGLETTIGLIGNGMRCFAHYPDQFELLAANPELAGSAAQECLRFEPSVPMTVRVLWEDTDFGGVTIPADSVISAHLIAANRDPAVFSDPDRFDITRNEARHCSFGGGIHFCLGSHLARMNAEVAFASIARRIRDIELDEDNFRWAPSLFRIPGNIPARFALRS